MCGCSKVLAAGSSGLSTSSVRSCLRSASGWRRSCDRSNFGYGIAAAPAEEEELTTEAQRHRAERKTTSVLNSLFLFGFLCVSVPLWLVPSVLLRGDELDAGAGRAHLVRRGVRRLRLPRPADGQLVADQVHAPRLVVAEHH